MAEPLKPGDERTDENAKSMPEGPVLDPTRYAMHVAGSAGTIVFASGGIVFCLQDMMEAFLIAMLLIITLAIGNILLLALGCRQTPRAVVTSNKRDGSQTKDYTDTGSDWSKSQKVGR